MDIEKAREATTDKIQAMVFIQNSSRQYVSKGRDEYPTTMTLAYNIMLEWEHKPGPMQGG